MIHIHKWPKWQDGKATYDSPLFGKRGVWTGLVQHRRCTRCGKLRIRRID